MIIKLHNSLYPWQRYPINKVVGPKDTIENNKRCFKEDAMIGTNGSCSGTIGPLLNFDMSYFQFVPKFKKTSDESEYIGGFSIMDEAVFQ